MGLLEDLTARQAASDAERERLSPAGLLNMDLSPEPLTEAQNVRNARQAALAGSPNQFSLPPQPQVSQVSSEDQARIAAAGNPLTRAGDQINQGVRGLLGPDFGRAAETVAEFSPAEDIRSFSQGLLGIGQGIVETDGAKLFKGLQDTVFGVLGSFPGGDAAVASLKAMAGFGAAAKFRRTPVETEIEKVADKFPDTPHIYETATLPSGSQLEIIYAPNLMTRDATGHKSYDITFTVNGGMAKGAVAPQDAMPLMATVRGGVNKFMQDVDPDKVTFARAYPELEGTYNRTVKGLAKGFDGKVRKAGQADGGFEVDFKDLAHPEREAKRKAASSEVVDPAGLERFPRTPGDRPASGQISLLDVDEFGPTELDNLSILERFGREPFAPSPDPQFLSGAQQRARSNFGALLQRNRPTDLGARDRTPPSPGPIQPEFLPRHQGQVRSPSAPLGVQDLPRREGGEGQLLFPGMDLRISEQIPVPGGLLDPQQRADILGRSGARDRLAREQFDDPGQIVDARPQETFDQVRQRQFEESRAAAEADRARRGEPTMDEIVASIRELIDQGATP